jgi:hypothetical protein
MRLLARSDAGHLRKCYHAEYFSIRRDRKAAETVAQEIVLDGTGYRFIGAEHDRIALIATKGYTAPEVEKVSNRALE